ncbi:TetR/AcrR family transcriptional regulator [Nonomuraea diastatica]|uniref:TetR/AcrR family transcriptional regulator n=1 Tax=Nonomuraea diastatica TaxID=1848329 RepID=UPI001C705215|nr:TetR/AcrR family transcriptional regulator [Nonomuraea diastatica]
MPTTSRPSPRGSGGSRSEKRPSTAAQSAGVRPHARTAIRIRPGPGSASQGFERTSVAQIARAAGLTERSFYRYFPDKREVLFAGNELQAHLVAQVEAADPGLTPIEALLATLGTADEIFRPREFLLRRVTVIAASPALAERDLIKLADAPTRWRGRSSAAASSPARHASSSTWR